MPLDSGADVGEASSVVVADGLVGREAELAALMAAIRDLGDGRASTLAIEGEAGIGKTRLVAYLVDHARSSGVTTFLRSRRRSDVVDENGEPEAVAPRALGDRGGSSQLVSRR